MTDRVTNIEVEDVLSSIRRLVAEGDRARPLPPDAPRGKLVEPSPRLVLTPALRVRAAVTGAKVTEAANAPAASRPKGAGTAPPRLRLAPENRAPADPPPARRAMGQFPAARPAGNCGAEPPAGPFPRARAASAETASDARQRRRTQEWAQLEATIAELEAAVTRQAGDWEPDGTETAELAAWVLSGARPSTPAEADQADAAQRDLVAGSVDEAMLRDLVTRIIRQELRGELGERITRNVRMMVRRELGRLLAERGMD